MSCFLYFEITGTSTISFSKEKIVWVKKYLPELTLFDFDSFSDILLKNYAMQLVQENMQKVLYIEISDEGNVKGTLGFLEKLLGGSSNLLLLCNRKNSYIEIIADQYNIPYCVANEREEMATSLQNFLS